jgi:multiple antibiotic resistance protein
MFLLIGPVSGVAIIVALMPQKTTEERVQIIIKACWVAYGMMIFFALTGNFFLDTILSISREAFQIGGGLYLLTLGIDMLGLRYFKEKRESPKSPSTRSSLSDTCYITPIAIPLITGPGVITAILTFRSQIEGYGNEVLFLLSLSMTMVGIFACFYFLIRASASFTPCILYSMERFAGLLTTCLALDIVIDGVSTYLANI